MAGTVELRLLLACARVSVRAEDEVAIHAILADGVNWAAFAHQAIHHGLAPLVGYTLARVARDAVPDDLLEAFQAMLERTRRANAARFAELAAIIAALADRGIAAIPFKGPMLALGAYGDFGLRVFRDLDLLIHDRDVAATIAALATLGYGRQKGLNPTQYDWIHWLQGQEILFKSVGDGAVEPHTRLTSVRMALDINYAALWQRAQRRDAQGHNLLRLAPEDELVVLAIHGGKELWWSIKWVCDFAVFLDAHPDLDWIAILERARTQGCLRMVLLATALARRCFEATVPNEVAAAERCDRVIASIVTRILRRWQANEVGGPDSYKMLSMARLLLHDGWLRRASYVARTLFLPGPDYVAAMPLPRVLGFLYVPLKLGHDLAAWPLWAVYRQVLTHAQSLPYALAGSPVALAAIPLAAETKRTIRQHEKARLEAEREVAANPKDWQAWRTLGDAFFGLKRYTQAISAYDSAIALAPDNASLWRRWRNAMTATGRGAELPSVAREPQDAVAWTVRAGFFWFTEHFRGVAEATDNALNVDSEYAAAIRLAIIGRIHSADWRQRDEDRQRISDGLERGISRVPPIEHRCLNDSEDQLYDGATVWTRGLCPSPTPLPGLQRYQHRKIRIAYISAGLRSRQIGSMIVGCLENHDRRRFEIHGISLDGEDGSALRRRIVAAFDNCVPAYAMTDETTARAMRDLEIDIAVDLNGYIADNRPRILAYRPAPVQVSFLGYPGTMAAAHIDYLIADQTVIPPNHQIHYSEKLAYLPHSYMPLDDRREIAANIPNREEAGLPAAGFVFACFNPAFELAPEVFDAWMRLLRNLEGSLLWLRDTNGAAMRNLRREAEIRGVNPDRLIFAPRVTESEKHLARLKLVDLMLDTLPYNGDATTCEALWAGVPVLTCMGNAFAGRVSASVLQATNLRELITTSIDQYEALAFNLAREPAKLAGIRARLLQNHATAPLFDTAKFTRDLESAYTMMWDRNQRALPAESFSIPHDGAQPALEALDFTKPRQLLN